MSPVSGPECPYIHFTIECRCRRGCWSLGDAGGARSRYIRSPTIPFVSGVIPFPEMSNVGLFVETSHDEDSVGEAR